MTFLSKKKIHALLLGLALGAGFGGTSFFSPTVLAQTSMGTLTGVVRDSSGAAVVGATLTATGTASNAVRATKTTSLGTYRLDALTPGQYSISVEMTGFERYLVTDVTVSPSQVVSFDLNLKPGHVEQTVTVTADNQQLVNQENASLSATISQEELAKLPVFSLNPIEILTTVPGVQVVSNTNFTNGESIQVSGARPRANNFMIDGEEINDAGIAGQAVQPAIPDMYSDVIIYTHNPPAEYGRASGGVVNMITKGGTNSFHGSAFELYSGSGLNSQDAQARQAIPASRSNKGRYDKHQYGFTAGGPIIKDKLFAFGAAQWSRYYGNETANQVSLPNADGVALLKTIAAGGNATTATNAALMLEYLSDASYLTSFIDYGLSASASLGNACPASQAGCSLGIDTFQRPATPEKSPGTQWTYRIDYKPTEKDSFSARYLHDRTSLTPDFFTNGSSLPGFDTFQGGPSELGQGTWTHIFSSGFLNEFRAAETRLSVAFSPTAEALANPLYNYPSIFTNVIQDLGFNQSSFPQGNSQDMYQFQDTVSWTHGRHTVRAGADVGRRIETDLNPLPINGTITFTEGGNGSSAVGNFLLNELGPSGHADRTFGNTRVDPHSWRSSIFAQDDIKIASNFTVNLGIRWDYFTNPDNSLPYPAINPSSAATLYGPIDTVYKVANNLHSFAPRVGFSFSPQGGPGLLNGKTTIRGGFGIFFDPEFSNITTNTAASAPNVVSGEIQQTATGDTIGDATGLISQISGVVDPYSTVTSVVNNLTTPYTEEWNLGFDSQLPGNVGLSVTYVGSHGIKLFANQQYNYQNFDTGERLNTDRGIINARGNFASSLYNGLEVGAKHNFSHGLAIQGEYVYSKTLDDGSDVFAPDSAATSYAANLAPGKRNQDWGNSVFDHRQYLAFTYVWSPAGLRSKNAGLDKFLSGATRHWTISGASRFQSGAYATLSIAGLDTNGDGSSYNDRPLMGNKKAPISSVGIDGAYLACPTDDAGNCLAGTASGTPGVYYDLAVNNNSSNNALSEVSTDSVHWLIPYGSQYTTKEVGRNNYLTPGAMYNDIALERAIPVSFFHVDHGQFVLRAEVQNIANHNNLNYSWLSSTDNGKNMNLLYVGTSTFLNTASARDSSDNAGNRSLRFWAKYTF
jgi:hypothetical protein